MVSALNHASGRCVLQVKLQTNRRLLFSPNSPVEGRKAISFFLLTSFMYLNNVDQTDMDWKTTSSYVLFSFINQSTLQWLAEQRTTLRDRRPSRRSSVLGRVSPAFASRSEQRCCPNNDPGTVLIYIYIKAPPTTSVSKVGQGWVPGGLTEPEDMGQEPQKGSKIHHQNTHLTRGFHGRSPPRGSRCWRCLGGEHVG